MKIALGADHAGFPLKSEIAKYLIDLDHEVLDFGTDSEASVDYPAYCAAAARAVTVGDADLAIVFGGSGQGEQIAANKVHGARAALCFNEFTARLARTHNNANVLALGARIIAPEFAKSIVDTFLTTEFEGGRHQRRLDQLTGIEKEECGG